MGVRAAIGEMGSGEIGVRAAMEIGVREIRNLGSEPQLAEIGVRRLGSGDWGRRLGSEIGDWGDWGQSGNLDDDPPSSVLEIGELRL